MEGFAALVLVLISNAGHGQHLAKTGSCLLFSCGFMWPVHRVLLYHAFYKPGLRGLGTIRNAAVLANICVCFCMAFLLPREKLRLHLDVLPASLDE